MDMLLLVIIGSELILDRKNHIIINIKIIYIPNGFQDAVRRQGNEPPGA